MSMKMLNKDLGFYQPAFFYMQINEDVIPKKLSDFENESTVFHEYVHFIQDVSTVSGLIYLDYAFKVLQSVVFVSYQNHPEMIVIPVNTTQVGNSLIHKDFIKTVVGDSIDKNSNTKIVKIEQSSATNIKGYEWLKIVTIIFDDDSKFKFGTYAIKETMAYLMEKQLFPNSISAPAVPYHLGKLVVYFTYGTIAKNILNIIALCDVSLMYSNPGEVFYNSLLLMKEDNFDPKDPKEVYDYVYKEFQLENGLKPNSELFRYYCELKNTLFEIFGRRDDFFINEYEWTLSIIKDASAKRISDPYFIINMLKENTDYMKNEFYKMMQSIGMPTVYNSQEISFVIDKKGFDKSVKMDIFRAFIEINELLENGVLCNDEFCCTMKDSCKHAQDDRIDENCDASPWLKATQKELCPFAILWHRWGLTGKNVIESTE